MLNSAVRTIPYHEERVLREAVRQNTTRKSRTNSVGKRIRKERRGANNCCDNLNTCPPDNTQLSSEQVGLSVDGLIIYLYIYGHIIYIYNYTTTTID